MKQTLNNPSRDDNKVIYDCVYFGKYPQSGTNESNPEPIKWRVLKVKDNIAFLHADQNLDVLQFHTEHQAVYWKDATVRAWLNNDFINRAFTADEQAAIIPSSLIPENSPAYEEAKDKSQKDQIILLAYDEILNPEYGFSPETWADNAKVRTNTAYVASGGKLQSSDLMSEAGESNSYFLRTPNDFSGIEDVDIVFPDGRVFYCGGYVNEKGHGICPALRLDLNSEVCVYAGTVELDTHESQ